jgi:hypothetical protein
MFKGKTEDIAQRVTAAAVNRPGSVHVIFTRHWPWEARLVRMMMDRGGGAYRATSKQISYPNGSTITFHHVDNQENALRGRDVTGIVWEDDATD